MDHPLDENVLETQKYAFLLGCSLRQNNLEQFFSVYDAILPKHLSESQLDKIKERARQISELPEDEFNVLVLSARDFSLAQGCPPKMSRLEGIRGPGTDDWTTGSEDEEDGTEGKRHSYSHDDTFPLGTSGLKGDDGCERDSGLPSSGKGAGSWCDHDMSDSEERGVYDYFPTEESIKRSDAIKISHTVNPDFDEVHDVESDKSSIESPRSDASSTNEYNVTNPLEEEGTEMKTFSRQEFPCFSRHNIHKALYRRNEIPYTVLRNDDDEEYHYPASHQQRRFLGRSVDDTVCFSSLSRRHYSHTPEEAESGGFQNETYYSHRPPFGVENQLKSVGNSLQSLLSSTSSAVNMPPGVSIHDDARKKKNMKKKKGSKDDGDEHVSNSKTRKSFMNQHHDENGNPIDLSAYRQMRELPNKTAEGSVVSSRKHSNYGTYTQHGEFSRETANFDSFQLQGQSAKDLEDVASNSDRKKLRKKTKEPVKLAQDIPNYVGNIDNVDYLVKFIETGEKQQKKKVSQKTSPGSEIAPRTDKVAKKSKDKKGKVGPADETSNIRNDSGEVVISPTPSTSEAPVSPPPTADIPPPVADANHSEEEDMGNSGDKSAATSVVDATQTPLEQDKQPHNKDTKVSLNKDIDPPEKLSSSKSPPLNKREVEHKDKNKTKTKEKDKSSEAAVPVENKKQKGKNGKSDLLLKNNKKLENKNDIINNTKSVDKMKIENGPIKVVSKLDSDDLGITDNHQDYIFTDIDNLPPVEQEFTLVSKKKKRQGAKDMMTEIPRQKNGPREYRGLPPPRSVTPPPSSLLKKEQSRDLSPSSFPALGKKANVSKGRPTFREGRRNSFGDVPIDTLTELRSQDDSDIESVKSLPAAKGGSLSDVVASRFPVSYAKMAAAPKPPNSPTSPKAEEDELCDVDTQSDSASSRKPTVWKGSPTERRHSIGSSPEDTKQENSPKFSQRSRQKSGSQEFLLNLDSVKSDVDVSVPDTVDKQSTSVNVSDVKFVSSSSSENTVSEELVATVSPGPQEPGPEAKSSPSSDSQSIPTITVTLDSNKVSSVLLKTDNQNSSKIAPNSGPPNGPQRTINTEVLNCPATSRSQPAVSSSFKEPRGKPVSVSARIGNNSRKNNKSVIFLDKRFGDAPENLDITFGFDSNLDQDVKGAREPVDVSVSDIQQEGSTSCDRKEPLVIHNQIEPQSIPVTLATDISPKPEPSAVPPTPAPAPAPVSTPASTPASTPTPTTAQPVAGGGGSMGLPGSVPPSSTSSASTTTSNTSKMSKTRVGGLNGVVLPKTQGYRNRQGSEPLRTERVATTSEPKGATASTVNKDNKTVLFFYGEGIVAKLGNSDASIDSRDADPPSSSQHKGQLAFSPDANHKGKFNVNEAVKYLKNEWDKVLEQKDKNPQAVQFYNGQ